MLQVGEPAQRTGSTFTLDEIVPTWDNTIGLDVVLHEDDYLATSENTKLPALKSFTKSERMFGKCSFVPKFINDPPKSPLKRGTFTPLFKGGQGGSNKIFDTSQTSSEKRLAKVSNRKSAKKKGSKSRRKLAKREAREHQRIARSRRDHAFKTAHALVRTGKKVFVYEDLNLKALSKRNKAKQDEDGKYLPNRQAVKSGLNKSWNDAAFGQFFTILEYIAEKAPGVDNGSKPCIHISIALVP